MNNPNVRFLIFLLAPNIVMGIGVALSVLYIPQGLHDKMAFVIAVIYAVMLIGLRNWWRESHPE